MFPADPSITSIEDLRGKKVAVGSAGSGTEVMAQRSSYSVTMSYDDIGEDFSWFRRCL